MTTNQRRVGLAALALVIAACSSDNSLAEFGELTGLTDDEIDCVDDLADPGDDNPFSVMPDCLEIDRLRVVASEMVGAAVDLARESGAPAAIVEFAEENDFDLDAYQECVAAGVPELSDRELRVAFAAPTAEALGERLAEPFAMRCVGVAQQDPTLGIAAPDLARLVSGAVGRVDATLQNVTVVERQQLRIHVIGDGSTVVAAVSESPVDGGALSVQVILERTRMADEVLAALGEEFGFDPPTATNLTVTGSRELDNGLLACVLDDPVSVTIRPGPDPCPE